MVAEVVINRRNPIWLNRENAMIPASSFHHVRADAAWVCSGVARANHTLMSGKLNKLINLLVCKVNAPARRANQRRIEFQPLSGTVFFPFLQRPLDASQYQLARRTAPARRRFMNLLVQLARKIDRRADRPGLHLFIMTK